MSRMTFAIIKPDAVERKLVGEIISRFEKKGFLICGIKKHLITSDEAQKLYAVHCLKPFYKKLCDFMMQGFSYTLLLERDDAINTGRLIVDQIRLEYASGITENCIHASDGVEAFEHEYPIFFPN